MIPFDSSEILNWADKPDSQHQLPELIRRLILATVPMPSLLHMPSGSSVWLSGWDGLLVTEEGNAWAPYGASAWEFSTEKKAGSKATADYKKRTANPQSVDASLATFVFVTPRAWKGKDKWIKDRCKESHWADVRALDADDLVTWLGQAPVVAGWFARLIGKLPATGVTSLDEWWENWSTVTDPKVSPELVTAGRQDEAGRLAQWFQGEPSHYYLKGDTPEETIAFLAASAHSNCSQWGAALLTRAVVVHNADAWRSLEGHPSPLLLVRNFSDGNVSPQLAVGRGHHVLTPLGDHQETGGTGVTLPRLGREETREALAKMGLSEAKARALTRSTARRLPIMRRRLVDEAGGPMPEWVSSSTPRSLVALILVGQWDGDNEGDKAIVAEVVGESYEAVEQDLTGLMSAADSPVTKIGSRWRLVSHEEAWHLLAPRLTSSDVSRFEQVAINVFGTISPELELPVEERSMAGILGKVLPHSETVREGIARSLALLGTHHDRVKYGEGAAHVPARVISSVLEGGRGWQTWATLCDVLAVLAEASPEALLDAIERDLTVLPSPFQDLFAQEGAGIFGGTPHTGLLWALECLAWSQDHFARVAKILARLAEIDPGGQVSNRPMESLKGLFLPWIRFSEAPDEYRLEALKLVLNTVPGAGWQLLVGAYPSSYDHVTHRYPPSWRPWGQDGAPKPTVGDCHAFIREMDRLLLGNVGTNAGRWADFVEIIPRLSPDARQQAIGLLSQQTGTLRKRPDAGILWTRLRKVLHHHNSYPNADWAMDTTDIEALESLYLALAPSDPVAAYTWLFGDWPEPHNPPPVDMAQEPIDFSERDNQVTEARRAAVRAVYERGGPPAILELAEAAEAPSQVGVFFAISVDPRLVIDLAWEYLGSPAPKMRDFAHGALLESFRQSGWRVLEEAIDRIKTGDSAPQALADVYLVAPALRETWQRLDSESQEVRTAYWKSMWPPTVSGLDLEDLSFAVQQLLSVRRSADVLRWLALRPMPDELVVQILEAVPSDLEASTDQKPHVDAFRVAHLLEKLDQSDEVSDDVVAKLEIPYVEILRFDRPRLALHREVARHPALFADLMAWAFKRSDGQTDEAVDEQTQDRRATLAYRLVWELHTLPGVMEDGSVDAESLSTWVNEARRLCTERSREVVGDQQIGQVLANSPVGEDGIWPCEPVRDLLDSLASHHVGIGFVIGKSNLRGVTSRGVFDGGVQERSLSDKYREDAVKTAARWPFTANLLRQLAAGYESEGSLLDQQADWTDQFES